jgi:hypothetical protein
MYMEPVESTQMKVGTVMLTADSREELFKCGNDVQEWFNERTVVVPAQATARELRDWNAKITTSKVG